MAQLYDGSDAALDSPGDSSYGRALAPGGQSPQIKDITRVVRDEWIKQSDPNYWRGLLERGEATVPDTTLSLGYQQTPDQYVKERSDTFKRLYAADLDRDQDRKRNKQNLIKFAVLAGAAGLASGAMGAGGAGAGTGASQGLTMQIPETLAVGGGTTAGGSLPLLATGAAPAATITGTTAALAPQAIAPLAVGSSTAALPLLPTAAAPAATITGSTAAGGLSMKQLANAGMQAYSAYDSAKQQKEMAAEAAKPTTKTSTPYGNEYIAKILPWLFQEMQARYAGRLGRLGVKPTNYSPFAALLAGIPQSYTGVSGVDR